MIANSSDLDESCDICGVSSECQLNFSARCKPFIKKKYFLKLPAIPYKE